MTRRSPRNVAITAGQYVVALLALWWLARQIDIGAALERVLGLAPPVIAGLVAISLLGAIAQFGTWSAVLGPVKAVRFRSVASISLIVNFVNQLLPSRLSGRVAAPFVIRSETGIGYADAAAVSGVHTGVYAVLYGLVSTAGLLAIGLLESASIGLLAVLGISTGLYILAGGLVLLAGSNLRVLDPVLDRLSRAVTILPRIGESLSSAVAGLTDFTDASTQSFRRLAVNRELWLRYAASWSVVLLLAPAVRIWLLFAAFGVDFQPLALLPLYLVTAYSVTLLPISPGGVGVTEATATAVFVTLGVPGEVVVPAIFVDRILGIYLPAAIGWLPAAQLDLSSLSTDDQNGG